MDKKILVITVSSWNSKIGSNTWPTLLEGTSADNVANICIREEKPDSSACNNYFVISENRVLKSILKRKIKTGYIPLAQTEDEAREQDLSAHNERYQKMSKKRNYFKLLAREMVWKLGKWKTKELDEFLDSFKPDIILHSMEGYIHLNRIIQYGESIYLQ